MFAPLMMVPLTARRAAPTLKFEYGEYEPSLAAMAAAMRASYCSGVGEGGDMTEQAELTDGRKNGPRGGEGDGVRIYPEESR